MSGGNIYIYIYMYVCVCDCECKSNSLKLVIIINTTDPTLKQNKKQKPQIDNKHEFPYLFESFLN